MTTTTESATIYYTTDNSEPNFETGAIYIDPVLFRPNDVDGAGVTFKAFAWKQGMQVSNTTEVEFLVGIFFFFLGDSVSNKYFFPRENQDKNYGGAIGGIASLGVAVLAIIVYSLFRFKFRKSGYDIGVHHPKKPSVIPLMVVDEVPIFSFLSVKLTDLFALAVCWNRRRPSRIRV